MGILLLCAIFPLIVWSLARLTLAVLER